MRDFFICYCCLIGLNLNVLIAQKFQLQTNLNNVSEVIQSPNTNYLLAKKQTSYILIDQRSKIQVGSIQLELNKSANIGEGIFRFIDDKRFVINCSQYLLLVDILNNKVDTLKTDIVFPEFIENFIPVPDQPSKIIITTKKYPVNKDGIVSFIKEKSKQWFYEDIKNGNIYEYDLLKNYIATVKPFPFSVTFLTNNDQNEIIAGCFDGSILKIKPTLLYEVLFKAFENPVFNVVNKSEKFLVIPHQQKNDISLEGKGEIYLYDKNFAFIKTISLPKQDTKFDNKNSPYKALPSNSVINVLNPINQDLIYLNYGFNGLTSLNLKNLTLTNYNVSINSVKFHSLNFDNSQIISTTDQDDSGIFGHSGYLTLYDINTLKFIDVFKKVGNLKQFKDLNKVFYNSNYYYIGEMRELFQNSTLTVFGSNQNQVSKLSFSNDMIYNSQDNDLLLVNNSRVVIGQLKLDKVNKRDYLFKMKDYLQPIDSIPNEIFDINFDFNFSGNNIRLNSVLFFKKIDTDKYFIYGYEYHNKENIYSYLVVNSKGEKLFELKNHLNRLFSNDIKLSPSGKYFALCGEKKSKTFIELWDWQNNKLVFSQKLDNSVFNSFSFDRTSDAFWFRILQKNKYDDILDYYLIDPSQIEAQPIKYFSNFPYYSEFLPDSKNDKIYFNQSFYRLSNKTKLGEFNFPIDNFSIKTQISNEEIGYSTSNCYMSIADELKHVYFYPFDDDNAIEFNHELYYKTSKKAQENIGVVSNGKGYSASTFDVFFNRPDIIIKQAGSTNNDFNLMVEQAVLKRNKIIGVSKSLNSIIENAPEIIVQNHNEIKSFIEKDSLDFKLSFKTKMNKKITSLSIVINGVQVINTNQMNNQNVLTQKVKLSNGTNFIQLYVTDEEGYKSNDVSYTVYAEYQQKENSKVYLIYFAVDKYSDNDYNLKYAVKDAVDLSTMLKKRYGEDLIVKSFVNENATKENVIKVIDELKATGVNDKIILFVSGHGVLDANLDFRFATADMDFENINNYGIAYSDLESILLKSNARNKLLMIDACHSGNLDKETYNNEPNQESNIVKYSGYKGAIPKNTSVVQQDSFELMQQMFNEISIKNGIKVMSAAAGNSYALESDVWNNGVFTYSVLKTLQENSSISISKFNAVVSESVYNLTNARQKPTSKGNIYEFDFEL